MAAVGTWSFSRPAVERMRCMLLAGQNATDVVETAVAEVEDDVDTGRHIVGRGGYPNIMGVVECDAAIMEGVPGRFGAVAALRGIAQPCRVARKVMEKSPHSFLVGEGAEAFALEQGFTSEPNDNMLSDHTAAAYREFIGKNKPVRDGHDTIGLIALDLSGNITVGVSTSGAPFKSTGRVGDSPLPGCGLYADHTVGAAAATGDGDKIMCYCPSFHVVQLMRQGLSPNEACHAVLSDIQERIGDNKCFEIGLISLNMKGESCILSGISIHILEPRVKFSDGAGFEPTKICYRLICTLCIYLSMVIKCHYFLFKLFIDLLVKHFVQYIINKESEICFTVFFLTRIDQ